MNPGAWVAIIAAAAGLFAFVAADVPVQRSRVEAFARRRGVVVTDSNAHHLVRYLALTRRWRVAGVVSATMAFTVHGLQHQTIGVDVLVGLAGWFTGAIIAELRIAGPVAVRRVASLERRTVGRYVPALVRLALLGAMGLSIVAAASLAWGLHALVLLTGAVALPLVVTVVSHRVVVRRQPIDPPDILAADEAIRRNSVRTLHAAATTLLLYGAAGPLILALSHGSTAVAVLVSLVCMAVIPIVGWRLGSQGAAGAYGLAQ
jgi:hypothetical protein